MECPLRDTCYRAQAPDSEYHQSMARFEADDLGHCSHYWSMGPAILHTDTTTPTSGDSTKQQ